MVLISFCRKKEMQTALSDGLLSISFTKWANEEAQQKDLKGVKVEESGGKRTTKRIEMGMEGGRR